MRTTNDIYDKLAAHIKHWRKIKGKGFNANPFAELNEKVRWLCSYADGQEKVLLRFLLRLETIGLEQTKRALKPRATKGRGAT